MSGLLIEMNSLDACDDIAEGIAYAEKVVAEQGISANFSFIGSIIDLITQSVSLGTAAANFPATTGESGRTAYQLTFKNDSLMILVPASVQSPRQAAGIPRGAYYTHTIRPLFPGEECQYRVEANRLTGGLHTFVFFGISTDPTLVSEENLPGLNEVMCIEICVRLGSQSHNRTQIEYIQIDNDRISPRPTWGASDMMYATHRRNNQSKEASFGMVFYGSQYSNRHDNEVVSNVLTFTPSGKTDLDRPSQPTPPGHNPDEITHPDQPGFPPGFTPYNDVYFNAQVGNPARMFCRETLMGYSRNGHSSLATYSIFGAITGVISLASAAMSIAEAINSGHPTRDITLTLNIHNASDYPIFVVRRQNSNSLFAGDGLIKSKMSLSIPFRISQLGNEDGVLFLRMVLGHGRPNLDITINIRDYGHDRFVKISRVSFYNAGSFNENNIDSHHSLVHSSFFRSNIFEGVRSTVTSTAITHRSKGHLDLTVTGYEV
ncbi:hypothetical protein [Erwinia psidii]|uniref:Uncharacterized protein n=1 Tax=Erwinia psidii TaxID=69224 RepID=A0A3N6S142_9GAMM|nr:hypothetical protein [Erwinia psidii]MCX8956278.1 hypothetical protein [Erwinia psidii]MCX8959962.1 hypothetical protein [Erwinia psidii]RQM39278.1 hypothetical protein EB241_05880 [Erwinia psidii]